MKYLKQIFSYDVIFSILCIFYTGMLLHYTFTLWGTPLEYGILFLTMTLIIAVVVNLKEKGGLYPFLKRKWNSVFATLIIIISLAGGIYYWTQFDQLRHWRAGDTNTLDRFMAFLLIVIIIQMAWTYTGRAIPIVTLAFSAYALFGDYLPTTLLHHGQISLNRFLEISGAELDGIFGSLNQIGATWVAVFCFLAGFIQAFGGMDYILRLSWVLVRRFRRGLPQMAVVGSMGFGMMSGSSAANAVGTGAYTIPLMKSYGMPPKIAAAIEATASSGGQIMPPVMGAVAFLICDYLGKYYYEIVAASLLPSLLFYGCVALGVFFLASKYMSREDTGEIPDMFKQKLDKAYILQGTPLFFCLAAMVYVFVVYRVGALVGGFVAIASFVAMRLIYDLVAARGKPSVLITWIKGLLEGTKRGTTMLFPIGVLLACLGIVVRVLLVTGLGQKISFYMVEMCGGNLWLLLFFSMIVCVIFGMAVTSVAAYILVVTLAAPALLQVGIPPLSTHFAVFYWSLISGFTPPVAAVVVVTSRLAKSGYLPTCWESIKLSLAFFLLPFVFCTRPDILSFSVRGLAVFIPCAIGLAGMVVGIQGFSKGIFGMARRALLIIFGALSLFHAEDIVVWGSLAAVVLLLLMPWLIKRLRARGNPALP